MKTIEQIALEVAKDTPNDMHEEAWIVWFATKLIVAWLEQQESVGEVTHNAYDQGILFRDCEPGAPLFLAPPPAIPDWISVEDRLPEPFNSKLKKPQAYLCYVPDEKNIYGGMQMILHYGKFSWIDVAGVFQDATEDGEVLRFGWHYERDSEGEYDSLIFDMNGKVTHWMPIPKPPAQGE